jgi:signal transduction histidine kinase
MTLNLQTVPDVKKKRVLIVDDNVQTLRALKILIENDFAVNLVTVSSVAACKIALEKNFFDIVISDYDIGDGTCFDVLTCIKQHNIQAPVILITALGSKELAVESINKHFFAYLEKPIQPDQIKAVLASALDQKVREESEQRLVRLGLNSGELIHELATPLSIALIRIKSLRKQLTEENLSEKSNTLLNSIENTINRINILITSNKKALQSGHNFDDFPIKELHDLILDSCQLKANQSSVALSVEIPTEAHGYGDKHQLFQVLINLVNNAIDAVAELSEKWVKVQISQDTDYLSFTITDSGKGIPPDLQEKIFHPLFTTKRDEGTGLGLFISERIIRSHRGNIFIDAASPNTCFIVKIPMLKPTSS